MAYLARENNDIGAQTNNTHNLKSPGDIKHKTRAKAETSSDA